MDLGINMGISTLNSLKSIIEFISILFTILGLFSDDLILRFPILDGIVNSTLFSLFVVIVIIFIYIHSSLKEYKVGVQYRIGSSPEKLSLSLEDVKSKLGEIIFLYFKIESEEHFWIKFLFFFKYNLFVSFEFPPGITPFPDRFISELKLSDEKENRLIFAGSPLLSGGRKIKIPIEVNTNTSFCGDGRISVKIYIGPNLNILSKIMSLVFYDLKINITE